MRLMSASDYFAGSYSEAREKFLEAGADARASIESFRHPRARGPDGQRLWIDIARLGPADAAKAFVIMSGVHGVEGFCGSGVQVGCLRERIHEQLPDGAFILIHAVNPFGFAHLRRVNEENVDVNRNFVDHACLPPNPEYGELHALLVPADWGGPAHDRANREIGARLAAEGLSRLQSVLQLGQHDYPDGLFYGGNSPAWSHLSLRSMVRKYLIGQRHVALVDLHSGLGPSGRCEPIFRGRDAAGGFERARRWYGDILKAPDDEACVSKRIRGNVESLFDAELPRTELTAITLEFGTVSAMQVFEALRADNWIAARGSPSEALTRRIKSEIRDAFYCDSVEWKEAVWSCGREILVAGIHGLRAD